MLCMFDSQIVSLVNYIHYSFKIDKYNSLCIYLLNLFFTKTDVFSELLPSSISLRLICQFKEYFWETKNRKNYFFLILEIQCRIKDAHKIFMRNHAPITTDDNFRNWLFDYVLLQKIYKFHCKILCLTYNFV